MLGWLSRASKLGWDAKSLRRHIVGSEDRAASGSKGIGSASATGLVLAVLLQDIITGEWRRQGKNEENETSKIWIPCKAHCLKKNDRKVHYIPWKPVLFSALDSEALSSPKRRCRSSCAWLTSRWQKTYQLRATWWINYGPESQGPRR